MREFKFRGWNTEKMLYFDFSSLDDGFANVNHESMDIQRKEVVIMQCIGQKDCNGKEIYEGDILLYDVHRADRLKTVCVVGWIEDRAAYGMIKYAAVGPDQEWQECDDSFDALQEETSFPNLNETEIIGNLYQLPKIVAAP